MADKRTIMVVDDSPTNIHVLHHLLEVAGYDIAVAKSGETALERLQNAPTDLILLDVMMPGIDGFETCRRLKESDRTQHIPVIFMTASSDIAHKVKGLNLGAVDYITKPIQHEEALARIRIHLQIQELTQQLAETNHLLAKSNHSLEEQVARRTVELTNVVEKLKASQQRLIQQEKMSSLGQLVAGIAHEINNPVTFISGNLQYATRHVAAVLDTLALYQRTYPEPTLAIGQHLAKVDLDFIATDLPKLIGSMNVGAERIQQIISALRLFSRLDEAEYKTIDIHEGIDSTLMILQHRLKFPAINSAIQVVKNYGQLPTVECYAGPLNQVFMNILSNAVDAIESGLKGRSPQSIEENPGSISIYTTSTEQGWVKIIIADNGPGIPSSTQSRIFEPFFTTKPIGSGTGMGLSISYQIIVEQHHGNIDCVTSDQGTEFIIQIPVQQSPQKRRKG